MILNHASVLLLILAGLSSACLSSPPENEGHAQVLMVEGYARNNGSKPLTHWLNGSSADGASTERYDVQPGETYHWQLEFPWGGRIGVLADWHVNGETGPGGLSGSSFTATYGFKDLNSSQCNPLYPLYMNSTAWYANAGLGPANPALRHGLYHNSDPGSCQPVR